MGYIQTMVVSTLHKQPMINAFCSQVAASFQNSGQDTGSSLGCLICSISTQPP